MRDKKILYRLVLLFAFLLLFAFPAGAQESSTRVKNLTVTASGTSVHKLSWTRIPDASGYQVIATYWENGTKKVARKNLSGNVRSCKLTNRKEGIRYYYRVRAYWNMAGTKYYGTASVKKSILVGTPAQKEEPSSQIIVNPTTKQKFKLIFGDASISTWYPGGLYKTYNVAKSNMTTITVKTWDFVEGKKGKKYTRTWSLTVNKNIAPTVKQMFKELYEGTEKFPIHELGGFNWQGGTSEHNTGTAIDINWTENYMVDTATGQITAGSYWKPGKDPYSIPKDGELARIFKKYGFTQGDWGTTKDYMHFSYFGT